MVRFNAMENNLRRALILLLTPMLLLAAACGGGDVDELEGETAATETTAPEAAATPALSAVANPEQLEARIAALNDQVDLLRRQSEQMGREVESRLLQIDASLETIGLQLQNLGDELNIEARRAPNGAEQTGAAAPAPEPRDGTVLMTEAELDEALVVNEEGESNAFLMTVFWLVVLGAALILVWIVFQRWSDTEQTEQPRTQTTTNLGSVSYPSGSSGGAAGSSGSPGGSTSPGESPGGEGEGEHRND